MKQGPLWFATGGGASRMIAAHNCYTEAGVPRVGIEEGLMGSLDAPEAIPAGCDATLETILFGSGRSHIFRNQ